MHLVWEQIQKFSSEIGQDSPYGQALLQGFEALGQAQEHESLEAYSQAAEGFMTAIEASPESAEAFLGLAYLLVLLGDELSAIHYGRAVLEANPDSSEAQELLDLLASTQKLNSLLEDVERLCRGVGLKEQLEEEVMSDAESERLVAQTELLLQIHHRVVTIELASGNFKRLEQLNSRQQSLELLFEMLSAHLVHFLEDQHFGARLKSRLDVLAFDLESLQNLENLFDSLRLFQKKVQVLFRELTRRIMQLRINAPKFRFENQGYAVQLYKDLADLKNKLEAFPLSMRRQVETASGWNHLEQQAEQFHQLLKT